MTYQPPSSPRPRRVQCLHTSGNPVLEQLGDIFDSSTSQVVTKSGSDRVNLAFIMTKHAEVDGLGFGGVYRFLHALELEFGQVKTCLAFEVRQSIIPQPRQVGSILGRAFGRLRHGAYRTDEDGLPMKRLMEYSAELRVSGKECSWLSHGEAYYLAW